MELFWVFSFFFGVFFRQNPDTLDISKIKIILYPLVIGTISINAIYHAKWQVIYFFSLFSFIVLARNVSFILLKELTLVCFINSLRRLRKQFFFYISLASLISALIFMNSHFLKLELRLVFWSVSSFLICHLMTWHNSMGHRILVGFKWIILLFSVFFFNGDIHCYSPG